MIADIREGLRYFRFWEMNYVRQYANNIAHVFARAAVQQGVEGLRTENPPDCIVDMLVTEQLALPCTWRVIKEEQLFIIIIIIIKVMKKQEKSKCKKKIQQL